MSREPRPEADPFFRLTAFLIASARGALEEGVVTASLRLLDAAARLTSIAREYVDDDFLADLGRSVAEAGPAAYLESTERYIGLLDEVLAAVATEGARRAGVEPT